MTTPSGDNPLLSGTGQSARGLVYLDPKTIEQMRSYLTIIQEAPTQVIGLFTQNLKTSSNRLLKAIERATPHHPGAPATVREGYPGYSGMANKAEPFIRNNWDVIVARQDSPTEGKELGILSLVNSHPGAGPFIQGTKKASWTIGRRGGNADEASARRQARSQAMVEALRVERADLRRRNIAPTQAYLRDFVRNLDTSLSGTRGEADALVWTAYTAKVFGGKLRGKISFTHKALAPSPTMRQGIEDEMLHYTQDVFANSVAKMNIFTRGLFTPNIQGAPTEVFPTQ